MNDSYYSDKLSAERLKLCYDLATPPVRRYLAVESDYLRQRIQPESRVLELGCGYGRVLADLRGAGQEILAGIDISLASLRMARGYLGNFQGVLLAQMNAIALAFPAHTFDLVCCIQNGISAFHEDQRQLLWSAVRVARAGGKVLFSSYASGFWHERLEWFRIQAGHGFIGEIDERKTGNGAIVCQDGFTATTVSPDGFRELACGLGRQVTITEIDGCSVFCEIAV